MCINLIFVKTTEKFWPLQSILSGQIDQLGRLTNYTECLAFCSVVRIGSPPHPLHPQASVALPFWVQRGRHTRLVGKGVGDPISDEGTGTLVLYLYFNPSTGRLDNFWYPLDNPTQPLTRGREERGRTRGARMSFCWWGIRWSWAFKRYKHKIINK
jgi:hypothetical protein